MCCQFGAIAGEVPENSYEQEILNTIKGELSEHKNDVHIKPVIKIINKNLNIQMIGTCFKMHLTMRIVIS